MANLTRQQRAELARRAALIRREGQRRGWAVAAIAEEITRRLPPMTPLEAWRLAYGWSRPQVVEAIIDTYHHHGLADPGLTPARLCRWEHDAVVPNPDYLQALTDLYGVPPWRLGLDLPHDRAAGWYRRLHDPSQQGADATMADHSALTAVIDSVTLHREIEGPTGGPQTREHLERVVAYIDANYAEHPPAVLVREIHRCRGMVVDMLGHNPREADRRALRRLAGWLSALLGNFAFHLSDTAGAYIHLGTSARLGADVGEQRLTGWSLGAQSMVALFDDRPGDALDLARQAAAYAETPLHRAQAAAWCELRPLARLGHAEQARETALRAQRHMDAARVEDHGRFGFDRAELHQHLAEAALDVGDVAEVRRHAEHALALKRVGSGGWAAATLILARAHARRRDSVDACALATSVLDAVPAAWLRQTTRRRLAALLTDLAREPHPGPATRQLRDRIAALPAPTTPRRASPEPNGT